MAKSLIIGICILVLPLFAYTNTLSPLAFAQSQVGVRETSENCGTEIRQYLAAVGLPCGYKWCTAFVSACFIQAGYTSPRTAWTPELLSKGSIIKRGALDKADIKPQQVFGIYFPSLGRLGHSGMIESIHGNSVTTIEGNTNTAGSREGDGVYRKIRRLSQLHTITDYG